MPLEPEPKEHEKLFFEFINQFNFKNCFTVNNLFEKFSLYNKLLVEWNQKINLISESDLKIIWTRHFMDSLMPLELYPDLFKTETPSFVDIGTGAGFPGIPFSILFPTSRVCLIESIGKKCDFLKAAKTELGLNALEILNTRSEEAARLPQNRDSFDFAITRAAAKSATIMEYALPFLKIGGNAMLWIQGSDYDDQDKINKVCNLLSSKYISKKDYKIPLSNKDFTKSILLIEKTNITNKLYPRSTGIPQKTPLL